MEAIRFASEFVGLFDREDREEFVESVADCLVRDEETSDRAVLVINALVYALAVRGNRAATGIISAIQDS